MHPCFPTKRSVWKAGRVPKLLDHLYGKAKTVDEKCPEDVALFHEMLHWFHFLINYTRAGNDETRTDRPYCRLFEYYYGDQDNPNRANRGQVLDRLWGSKDFTGNRCHDGEELRTILGTPREDKHKKLLPGLENELEIENLEMTYYDYGIRYLKDKRRDRRYLHGDDLSENVYRLSVHGRGEVLTRMRFGHSNVTIPETDVLLGNKEILTVSETGGLYKNVFKLAHTVAMDCYKEITGKKKSDWELVPGQAAVEY